MSTKHISIVIALIAVATVAGCSAQEVYAQENTGTAPSQSGSGGSTSPPPPPPSGGGEFRPGANDSRFSPPEMLGRPIDGEMNRPQGGYQEEYKKQYEQEVKRQAEQNTRNTRERYAPPQDGGAFRPQGQPFMEGGKDNAQGRPFMDSNDSKGRPFSGDEFGAGGGAGFDEEAQEKMMQEREQMMRQEQLKQMKRGMVSGLGQGLNQIRRMMNRLAKKGITVPEDAQVLVNELQSALDKIKAATELTEDVETAMEVIQDKGQDLGDVGQKLGTLEHTFEVTKQVAKEFARLDKDIAKAKKSKTAKDYPDIVGKIEGDISALKEKWESARGGILSDDSGHEEMRSTMEEIFEEVGEVRRGIGLLQQLSSISKMIKSAEKEIVRFDKEIAQQKRVGKDVTTLTSLLGEARAKLGEIKTLSKQSGFDPEDLFGLMQELEKIRNTALEELDKITGKSEASALGASVIQALTWRRLGF